MNDPYYWIDIILFSRKISNTNLSTRKNKKCVNLKNIRFIPFTLSIKSKIKKNIYFNATTTYAMQITHIANICYASIAGLDTQV